MLNKEYCMVFGNRSYMELYFSTIHNTIKKNYSDLKFKRADIRQYGDVIFDFLKDIGVSG